VKPKQLKKLEREFPEFVDKLTANLGRPERREALRSGMTGYSWTASARSQSTYSIARALGSGVRQRIALADAGYGDAVAFRDALRRYDSVACSTSSV
jgi:hypothetical protein